MKNPAIVVNAYQRPDTLKRLLNSLVKASIPGEVTLIISLESNAHPGVVSLAENLSWPFGKKELIRQKNKLGLVGHFLACGALSKDFGSIVYLEDDLFVGPGFYKYSLDVLAHYQNEDRIAGFSLNSLWFNGFLHTPFKPIDDGNSVYFLQIPWYQGQVYTRRQWEEFETWYASHKVFPEDSPLHESFKKFGDEEWFPIMTHYLSDTGKYYCFPRISHCVNFGDEGTHFKQKTNFFQTELATEYKGGFYCSFDEADAHYDSYFELSPEKVKKLNPDLRDFDFTMDLNGTKRKSIIQTLFVITRRKSTNTIQSFGLEMRPPELNVIFKTPGDFFNLSNMDFINWKSPGNQLSLFYYHFRFRTGRKMKVKLIMSLFKSLFGK